MLTNFPYRDDIGEELPVKQGFLNVVDPQASGFSFNLISKKKSSLRYCFLFKASRYGIERLEIGESKDDKNPKIVTLENCVKITQEPSPANMILIVKKTQSLTLNTLNDDDLKEWVNALQTVAFRDENGSHSSTHAAIEEDNDLYCSSYGDGLFIVKLIPSETSVRCNIEPKTYMLHLTGADLQLKSAEDINVVVAKWPYRFIRKYGYRDRKFTFEAGRKCSTGEGVFTLDYTNPQEIFRYMSGTIKSTKKRIQEELPTGIDWGENQLSLAASMEAGSRRTPLPPSPSSEHMSSDFEMNSLDSSINTSSPTSSICIEDKNASATLQSIPDNAYDHLDFLIPNNKTSESYKTILTINQPPVALHRSRCSLEKNNYEEFIPNPDTQACRKADDHLGYGRLRKATTGVSPLVETAKVITNATPPLPRPRGNNNARSPTTEQEI